MSNKKVVMLNIKRNILQIATICIFILPVQSTYAQQKPAVERAKNQTRWMERNLKISQEQSDKVYEIILFYARQAERANMAMLKGQDLHRVKNGIKYDQDSELSEVLNSEQFHKYKMHMEEMKRRRKEIKEERRMSGVY